MSLRDELSGPATKDFWLGLMIGFCIGAVFGFAFSILARMW